MVETHRLTLGLFTAVVLTAITASIWCRIRSRSRLADQHEGGAAPRAARTSIPRPPSASAASSSPRSPPDGWTPMPRPLPRQRSATPSLAWRPCTQVAGQPLAERMHRVRAQLVDELGVPLTEESTEAALTVDKQTLDLLRGRARHLGISTMQHPKGSARARRTCAGPQIPSRCGGRAALPAPQRDLVRAIANTRFAPRSPSAPEDRAPAAGLRRGEAGDRGDSARRAGDP